MGEHARLGTLIVSQNDDVDSSFDRKIIGGDQRSLNDDDPLSSDPSIFLSTFALSVCHFVSLRVLPLVAFHGVEAHGLKYR